MSSTHTPSASTSAAAASRARRSTSRRATSPAERLRIETPSRPRPRPWPRSSTQIVDHFADETGDSPIGVTVPAVVTHGVVRSAANIDQAWIGTDAEKLHQRRARPRGHRGQRRRRRRASASCTTAPPRAHEGLVILTTLGTGIGTRDHHRGVLVPNTELGHLEIDGHDAETRAASSARENEDLSWEEWAKRLQRYYAHVEDLLWPDLIVVGGGVSKKADKFLPLLHLRAPIVPAALQNQAGIIGAAWLAVDAARS